MSCFHTAGSAALAQPGTAIGGGHKAAGRLLHCQESVSATKPKAVDLQGDRNKPAPLQLSSIPSLQMVTNTDPVRTPGTNVLDLSRLQLVLCVFP